MSDEHTVHNSEKGYVLYIPVTDTNTSVNNPAFLFTAFHRA